MEKSEIFYWGRSWIFLIWEKVFIKIVVCSLEVFWEKRYILFLDNYLIVKESLGFVFGRIWVYKEFFVCF